MKKKKDESKKMQSTTRPNQKNMIRNQRMAMRRKTVEMRVKKKKWMKPLKGTILNRRMLLIRPSLLWTNL
jgi:hypothetical protein